MHSFNTHKNTTSLQHNAGIKPHSLLRCAARQAKHFLPWEASNASHYTKRIHFFTRKTQAAQNYLPFLTTPFIYTQHCMLSQKMQRLQASAKIFSIQPNTCGKLYAFRWSFCIWFLSKHSRKTTGPKTQLIQKTKCFACLAAHRKSNAFTYVISLVWSKKKHLLYAKKKWKERIFELWEMT